jgi:hypothetical protein
MQSSGGTPCDVPVPKKVISKTCSFFFGNPYKNLGFLLFVSYNFKISSTERLVINPAVIDLDVKIKTFKVFKIKIFFGDRGSAPVTPPF